MSRFLQKFMKFLGSAQHMASLSKDRSTKVGAIALDDHYVIKGHGYNGFPRGVNDDIEARHERPAKYKFTVHAEMNVIAQAARPALEGTTLVLTSLHPCSICAGMLIQAGIRRVIAPRPGGQCLANARADWDAEARYAYEMLEEAGVELVYYDEAGNLEVVVPGRNPPGPRYVQ